MTRWGHRPTMWSAILGVSILAGACSGGSGGPEDELACVRTLVEEHERAASDAAEQRETAAARLPAKELAQKEVAADLRRAATRLSRAGGGCA